MEKIGYNFIQSDLCNIGVVWIEKGKNSKIRRIFLCKKSDNVHKRIIRIFPGAKQIQNKKINFILKRIKCCLKGEISNFYLSDLEETLCSKFQWAVSLAARQIPYGRVVTYKGLAKVIGVNSARAVGSALAKNPFPIIIPCHRVVAFNRKIGGFSLSAGRQGSGQNLKKALLRLEGIKFDRKGRVPKEFFI